MSTKDTTYNGWINYATWRVNLEILDDWAAHYAPSDGEAEYRYSDLETLAAALEEVVNDLVLTDPETGREREGLAADYARAFLADVDYYDIAETIAHDCPDVIESDDADDDSLREE